MQALPCAGSQVEAVQSPLGDVRWGCQSSLDTWVGPCFSLVVDTQSEQLGPAVQRGGTLPWKRGYGGEDSKPPLYQRRGTCVHVCLASPGIAFLLCSLVFLDFSWQRKESDRSRRVGDAKDVRANSPYAVNILNATQLFSN